MSRAKRRKGSSPDSQFALHGVGHASRSQLPDHLLNVDSPFVRFSRLIIITAIIITVTIIIAAAFTSRAEELTAACSHPQQQVRVLQRSLKASSSVRLASPSEHVLNVFCL